jgi:hypothetical protein
MSKVRSEDPKLSNLTAVLEQWSIVIGDRRVTTREVAETAAQQVMSSFSYPDFRDALLGVAAERGEISTGRLGRWLSANKGREVAGKRIVPAGMALGLGRWSLVRAGAVD